MDISQAINICRPGSKWTLNGGTYAGLIWLEEPETKPTETELNAAWAQISNVKIWPSKSEFWSEFSTAEKAAIISSSDIGIRLLDKELTMWTATVRADDARILAGLAALTAASILTTERSTAILS